MLGIPTPLIVLGIVVMLALLIRETCPLGSGPWLAVLKGCSWMGWTRLL